MKVNEVERQSFEDKTKLRGRIRQLQKAVVDATAAREKEDVCPAPGKGIQRKSP